jgi:hypothetical protein
MLKSLHLKVLEILKVSSRTLHQFVQFGESSVKTNIVFDNLWETAI